MSIFFGGSPPITMKRTETSRTGFCLLEDIRNRRCSKIKRGTLRLCLLTVLQKPGTRGRIVHGLAVTSFPLRFRWGRPVGALR